MNLAWRHATEPSIDILRQPIMLRSIRNQILVPLVAIQAIAVATVAVTAATLAASRSEHQIIDRLSGVIDTLGHANFPYHARRPGQDARPVRGPLRRLRRTTAG